MDRKYAPIINALGKDRVKTGVPLKNFTTFGIGGPADLFYRARTGRELVKAVSACRQLKIDYFILGGGSNILVADRGFRGLVIKNEASGMKLLEGNRLRADSGTRNSRLVKFCQKRGLGGVEFLAAIPGTIGGAVRHNAHFRDPRSYLYHGRNFRQVKNLLIGDLVETVTFLTPGGRQITRERDYCRFLPPSSRFKKEKGKIILSVVLRLNKEDPRLIAKTLKEVFAWRLKRSIKNKETQADPFTKSLSPQPSGKSAGCIFSNLPNKWGHPSGRMIDLCGLKGTRVGGAKVSQLHANYIINDKNAEAKDVVKLIKLVKKTVREKFGVELKEEIDLIGF